MNRFHKAFGKRHVVLPVIHVVDVKQALANATVAREAGADGVFLINHEDEYGRRPLNYQKLLQIHKAVADAFPDWWVGVNCLDLTPSEIFRVVNSSVLGIWTDHALIDERRAEQVVANEALQAREAAGWEGIYFGGVAFKYQREVTDVARAAKAAVPFVDVITTSGTGTGQAASVEKIREMKTAVGDFPLAIASGITPENVADYLPYANCFLVATGISDSFEWLNPERTRLLVNEVNR